LEEISRECIIDIIDAELVSFGSNNWRNWLSILKRGVSKEADPHESDGWAVWLAFARQTPDRPDIATLDR
jgi:ribosomal protein S19E (S16A)